MWLRRRYVWLHRRGPALYPLVRTALLLTSLAAPLGYALFPTAPPRLAHLSIHDALSARGIDLSHGLLSGLMAVATGNHFVLDALAGLTVARCVYAVAALATAGRPRAWGGRSARVGAGLEQQAPTDSRVPKMLVTAAS